VRIPDDIGIVGFDDIPQARWMTPSLTTVVQDFEALGRQAVEAAEALIAGEAPESCQLSPTLAVRHSSRRH
jgi:DNA-binding LacI/PurR family transcriptional regulator